MAWEVFAKTTCFEWEGCGPGGACERAGPIFGLGLLVVDFPSASNGIQVP